MSYIDEVTDDAKALLRAVPEVAVDREWVRERLLTGRENGESRYSIRVDEHEIVRYKDRTFAGETVPVSCSEITGCCAMGYVELTAVCANGYGEEVTRKALDLMAWALVDLGWADDVLRDVYERQVEADPGGYIPMNWPDYGAWRDEVLEVGDWENVGEGIIPEWNDRHCQGKEQVLELVAKAAA